MPNPPQPSSAPIDPAVRDRLIESFVPFIRMTAERLAFRLPPYLDLDDLVNAGVIGLMDAIEKYDPQREARFKTYSEFRIRGAMLDEIRALDWVPRSVREKNTQLRRALAALEKQLGRAPSEDEIACEMQMGIEAYNDFLFQARAISLLKIEDFGLNGDGDLNLLECLADSGADPLCTLMSHQARERLMAAIERLPEREHLVVSLYYRDELTMKEIGLALKITESRVCQMHTQAIARLKVQIGAADQEKTELAAQRRAQRAESVEDEVAGTRDIDVE